MAEPVHFFRPRVVSDDQSVLRLHGLADNRVVDRDFLRIDTGFVYRKATAVTPVVWWQYRHVTVSDVSLTGCWRSLEGAKAGLHVDLMQVRALGPRPITLVFENINLDPGDVPAGLKGGEINFDGEVSAIHFINCTFKATVKLKVKAPLITVVDCRGKFMCWNDVKAVVTRGGDVRVVRDNSTAFPTSFAV